MTHRILHVDAMAMPRRPRAGRKRPSPAGRGSGSVPSVRRPEPEPVGGRADVPGPRAATEPRLVPCGRGPPGAFYLPPQANALRP